MKKTVLIICLLCTIFGFAACSKESNGVPESVILRDAESIIENCTDYKIEHNVDTAAHIDDVMLTLHYEDTYGTRVTTISYSYQYNKSNDLWNVIRKGNAMSMQTINKDQYIKDSPFTGSVSALGYRYSIVFHDIDLDKMIADIDCFIRFDNADIPDIAKSMKVTLDKNDPSFDVISEYEYVLGGYSLSKKAIVTFKLCTDYGLLTLDQLVSGEY